MATTALSTTDSNRQLAQIGELSVQVIVDRKRKIQEVMDAVMKEGEHYGRIPGSEKPSLYKAGAEILAMTFQLAPKFRITRTDMPNGHREYEITCTMTNIASGADLGEGVGSCSTMESKYRWRSAQRKCPKCQATAIFTSKNDGEGFYCWAKKGGCGAKFSPTDEAITKQETGRVENPDPADQWNTVLKMAKKRAQIDATLTVTGASDSLTQDLEDLPPGSIVEERRPEPKNANPGSGNQRDTKPANGRQVDEPDEAELEMIALDLIADINECKSPDAVRALAKRFSALPKRTRARANAADAYDKRIAETTPEATA